MDKDRKKLKRKNKVLQELQSLPANAKLSKMQQLRKAAYEIEELVDKLQPIEDRKLITSQSTVPWFDLKLISEMGKYGASPEEISATFFCDPEIIKKELTNPESPLSIVYHFAAKDLRMKLRKAQVDNALNFYDTKMQIWLGKQILGQTDKMEIENTASSEYLENEEKRHERLESLERILKLLGSKVTQIEEVPQDEE